MFHVMAVNFVICRKQFLVLNNALLWPQEFLKNQIIPFICFNVSESHNVVLSLYLNFLVRKRTSSSFTSVASSP